MQFEPRSQRTVEALLRGFQQAGVEYVVLRGYEGLPEQIPGSDLDLLVENSSLTRAESICHDVGLESVGSISSNAATLLRAGLSRPGDAATFIVDSPDKVLPYVIRKVKPNSSNSRGFTERHYVDSGLNVHIVNHLAYTSPMNESKIRVDPAVERQMFDRREEHDGYFSPGPADELAHLVCRGVFDYGGEFPDYYAKKCDRLAEAIMTDDAVRSQFEELLSRIFFKAGPIVEELVIARQFDEIREALYRFSDY